MSPFPLVVALGLAQASAASLQLIPPNPRYVFQPIAERFDISTATITALAQDHSGFLWMGTQQGVLRYDGGRITRYGREQGLPTSFIDQLIVAPDGRVWVGTNDGIARLNNDRFETIRIPIAGARIDSLYQMVAADAQNGIYVATSAGLLRIEQGDPSRYRIWTRRDGLPADAIDAVFAADKGAIYFISGNHVGRLQSPAGKPEILPQTLGGDPGTRNIAVLVDRDGVIWVRTPDHVLRLDPGSPRFIADDDGIPKANDFGIPSLDRSGHLMIPTVRGLFRRVDNHWERTGEAQGMASDAVFAATEDREGAMWVGYGGSGIARWPGSQNWMAWTKAEGLPDNVVWCVLRDQQQRLWVGTDNGLAMWDPLARRWRTWGEKDGLAGATVRRMALEPDGTIWTVSVPGGITRINPRTLGFAKTPFPPGAGDPLGIAVAPDGRIWAGNHRCLKILSVNGGKVTFEDVNVPPEAVGTTSHPVFTSDGVLWNSGRRGISRFDGHNWTVYTTAQGLQANVVPVVLPVSGSEAWFRYVQPLGLGHLKLTAAGVKVDTYSTKQGLASNGVFLIGMDSAHRVWSGGDKGVAFIDASGRLHAMDRADGLIWNDTSSDSFWSDADGSIYLGTSRGLARFQPATTTTALRPGVLLTSVKIGGAERVHDNAPRTPHSQATFIAQFAQPSFRDPEKTTCRYRMAGLENDYTETLQREARYVSLPSGRFQFEVSCQSADGAWSAPARYQFAVAPAWWQTWWAYGLGALLMASAIIGVIRLRTRALEADRRRLEQAVAERNAELARANQELAEAALTDPLTKARNRRFFQLNVEGERKELVLYLVDIDYFKQVNDRYGHEAGDLVLRGVADRLHNVIRASDSLIRWGGEEFLIVARNVTRERANGLAQRILDSVAAEPLRLAPVGDLRCTCSVGWAAFPWLPSKPDAVDVAEVVQFVDRALYMAKHSGRNQGVGLIPVELAGQLDERVALKDFGACVIRTFGPGQSAHVPATIHMNGLAGNVAIPNQHNHDIRDLVDVSEAPDGNALGRRVEIGANHVGIDERGRDGVRRNALLDEQIGV